MVSTHFHQIIGRAIIDPAYRTLLLSDPGKALTGYSLTDAQAASLKRMSPEQFYTLVGGLVTHLAVPLRVSRRMLVVPVGVDLPPAPDGLAIRLGRNWTFGNGAHPTTQACLSALEDYLQPGQSVLDLGTGSGILAIAAAKLGAAAVVALDVSAAAVEVAREHVAINDVAERVHVEQGSLDAVLQPIADGQAHTADLVVANILAPVVVKLLEEGLVETLKPGGVLVVSGFTERQAESVHQALRDAGLAIADQRRSKDWIALISIR